MQIMAFCWNEWCCCFLSECSYVNWNAFRTVVTSWIDCVPLQSNAMMWSVLSPTVGYQPGLFLDLADAWPSVSTHAFPFDHFLTMSPWQPVSVVCAWVSDCEYEEEVWLLYTIFIGLGFWLYTLRQLNTFHKFTQKCHLLSTDCR